MTKQTFSCTECQHFYGIDGVGEMWISCSIHGDFKVKKTSCPNFKKKVTKLDLLREIRQLRNENEQLRQQVQILKKEVRDLLHLCDVCDIQSHLSDECEEVLNDE